MTNMETELVERASADLHCTRQEAAEFLQGVMHDAYRSYVKAHPGAFDPHVPIEVPLVGSFTPLSIAELPISQD